MNHIFMEFDKVGAEWAVVAYLANDGRMIDVVESHKDPHTTTGSLISGASYELVERESKLVGLHTDPSTISDLRRSIPELSSHFLPRNMSIRQAGKKSNHGLNYDMRFRRFALETGLEEKDAKRIADAYFQVAYPGIPVWRESVRGQLRKDRTLSNCFGRKRRFLGAWGDDLFREAYSFIPQSTVVDVVNRGMIGIYIDDSPLFAPLEVLAQVHDSLLIQYPASGSMQDAALVAQRIAFNYLSPTLRYSGREFSIRTDMKIGISWGRMIPVNLSESPGVLAENLRAAWEKANAKPIECTEAA